MAGICSFGEDMDQDDPIAGLHEVIERPLGGSLAGRRVVHGEANGVLLGGHVFA